MNAMNWLVVGPDILLLVMACVVALVDLFVTDPQRRLTFWLTQASLAAVALLHLSNFNEGATLYVVDQAGTATRRKVQVLHTFGTKVAVSGLEPGERVVIEGSQNVRPGGKVRIDAKPAAPGTTGVTPGSAASSDAPAPRERA